jgi:predicted HTH transcriptional regulator
VTEEEFEGLLKRGYETHGVEFKGPGNKADSAFLARVIRAILGMANRSDGGLVILGVESETLEPLGFDDDEAKAWLNYDDIAAKVNGCASPSVSFDLEAAAYQGRKFIIIRVYEFRDIPILCTSHFPEPGRNRDLILKRGACYVRARHKPETSEIPSEQEMRELLELAIDKGVEKFVKRAQRAGLFPPTPPSPMPPDIEALFNDQAEDLL